MTPAAARWIEPHPRRRPRADRLALAVAGFVVARAGLRVARRGADQSRLNYRGHPVSLAGGPALAVAASATAAWGAAGAGRPDLAAASLIGGLAAGAVGRFDDVAAGGEQAKGLRGHLGALRRGQVTTGVVKLVGLTIAGGLAAAALPSRRTRAGAVALPSRRTRAGAAGGRRPSVTPLSGRASAGRAAEVILGAGLIAGSANLVNLLDLRPGRALKAALLVSAPLLSAHADGASALAGPFGAVLALLPDDLSERVMLGDAGANALGAVLGVAVAARTGPAGRAVALAAVAGLTLASERWSFTRVIESTPLLRELDRLGTRQQ